MIDYIDKTDHFHESESRWDYYWKLNRVIQNDSKIKIETEYVNQFHMMI